MGFFLHIIFSNYHIFKLSYYQIIIFSNYHIFIFSNYHIFIFSNYHIFKLSNFQIIISNYRFHISLSVGQAVPFLDPRREGPCFCVVFSQIPYLPVSRPDSTFFGPPKGRSFLVCLLWFLILNPILPVCRPDSTLLDPRREGPCLV